jgi:hypothetical protein
MRSCQTLDLSLELDPRSLVAGPVTTNQPLTIKTAINAQSDRYMYAPSCNAAHHRIISQFIRLNKVSSAVFSNERTKNSDSGHHHPCIESSLRQV